MASIQAPCILVFCPNTPDHPPLFKSYTTMTLQQNYLTKGLAYVWLERPQRHQDNHTERSARPSSSPSATPTWRWTRRNKSPNPKANTSAKKKKQKKKKVVFTTGAANKGSGTADRTKTKGTNKTDPGHQDHTWWLWPVHGGRRP